VSGYTILGSDQFGDMYSPAGNMSLMIEFEDVTNAQAKFAALAEGGQARMPFGETFWAEGYGYYMDRYGILWQINCTGSKGSSGQA
ncbi:MAG: VOC family protein, partial [Anaerolineae bacterium]